jgi:hypothetical protein
MLSAEEIRFGGMEMPSPEVFRSAWDKNPEEYKILEKGYQIFANLPENKGVYKAPGSGPATLEQTWLVFSALGVFPVCVLTRDLPPDATKRIKEVVRVSPGQLVEYLREIQKTSGQVVASTLYYDGQTGHCISIRQYVPETDRFLYHDPWPAGSLLLKKNNIAGVDARAEGNRWSITGSELERVISPRTFFGRTGLELVKATVASHIANS